MTTIKDIARLSGCSVSTVSRVLNNHPYVTAKKRKKIQQIINDLDYTPNAKARALSKGQAKHIGVMLPYANHPYHEKLTAGIYQEAFTQGYKVTLLPTNYELEIERGYLEELKAKTFDGLIITSKKISFDCISKYTKYAPIVCCESTENFPISSVSIDREASYLAVFTQLKEAGHKKIGLTVGREEQISASSRLLLKSFRTVFGSLDEETIFRSCHTFEDGIRAGNYFNKVKGITAILANGDDVGAGVLQSLQDKSIQIIGEENLLSSRLLHFSTIDHHLDACGKKAFQLLLSGEQTSFLIPYTLIERK